MIGKTCYQTLCCSIPVSGICSKKCHPVENSIRKRTTKTFDVYWNNKDNVVKRYSVSILLTNGGKYHSETVHVFRDASKEIRFSNYPIETLDETNEAWPKPKQLTQREDQALRMLAAGLGTNEIADLMGIKPITARNHILRVLDRLNARNRLEAVAIGTRLKLI
jgi:DNA-binding CsgD family transcriptional regulator